MKIYHKINSNRTSLGFFVELTDKERKFLNYKFETRNLYVKEISELMNINRQNVYHYFQDKDICLYRFLQIQEILNFEIVSKKDIDNFMNKFYLETINEVKRYIEFDTLGEWLGIVTRNLYLDFVMTPAIMVMKKAKLARLIGQNKVYFSACIKVVAHVCNNLIKFSSKLNYNMMKLVLGLWNTILWQHFEGVCQRLGTVKKEIHPLLTLQMTVRKGVPIIIDNYYSWRYSI